MKSGYFFSFHQYRTLLKEIVTPQEIYETVEDIQLESLYKKGYRVLLFDLDNTLMTYQQHKVSLQKQYWIEKAKSIGFEIYLVSNNSSKQRVQRVAAQLKVEGLYFAMKPFPFGLLDLASQRSIPLSRSVLIGDQLFTDVILGNWLRIHTILVDPMDKRVSFLRTVQRELELFLLNRLEHIS